MKATGITNYILKLNYENYDRPRKMMRIMTPYCQSTNGGKDEQKEKTYFQMPRNISNPNYLVLCLAFFFFFFASHRNVLVIVVLESICFFMSYFND